MLFIRKVKNLLFIVIAILLAVVILFLFFSSPAPEHIEDTNGADNYSLTTITKRDIADMKMGSKGSISTSKTKFSFGQISVSDGVKYSSRKFTGVYLLYSATIFKGSDIHVTLTNLNIKEGNFGFYIVYDGRVVGQAEPDEFDNAEFLMENIEKTASVEYVLAGESANFSFISPTEW